MKIDEGEHAGPRQIYQRPKDRLPFSFFLLVILLELLGTKLAGIALRAWGPMDMASMADRRNWLCHGNPMPLPNSGTQYSIKLSIGFALA